MNLKIKNSLIVVGTLMIGIIIGFLINGRLTSMRMDNMRQIFIERGMEKQLMNTINPSQEQMEKIRPIFDDFEEKRSQQLFEHRDEQRKIFEEFEDNLRPHLTSEQFERLQRLKDKNRERYQNFNQGPKGKGRGQHKGGRNN